MAEYDVCPTNYLALLHPHEPVILQHRWSINTGECARQKGSMHPWFSVQTQGYLCLFFFFKIYVCLHNIARYNCSTVVAQSREELFAAASV